MNQIPTLERCLSTILDNKKLRRSSIRLKEYDYSTPGAYFVTVCAYNWKHLFGEILNGKMRLNRIGKMIQSVWHELPENYPGVDADIFVVMPNHLHGIVVLTTVGAGPCACPGGGQPRGVAPTMSLPGVVHRFKSLSSTRYRQSLTQKDWSPLSNRLWQRNYYEHVIRNENELNRIREYILYNPLQWQFDRENPEYIQDKNYDVQWADFEKLIYGKQKGNRQHVWSTCNKYYDQEIKTDFDRSRSDRG